MGVTVRRPIDTGFERLKPGPGNSPEQVRESQRTRIHQAMVELTAERGYAGLTVRGLTRTAQISTRTFYAHFANLEVCFASTYRSIMRWSEEQLSSAMADSRDWRQGLRRWIRNLAEAVTDQPRAAKLALIDAYDGGRLTRREIDAATANLERRLAAELPPVPFPIAQGVAAGIERVLRSRLLEGDELHARAAKDLAEWALGICDTEFAPRSSADPAPAAAMPLPASDRRDPAFAVFEVIGGERGRLFAAVARLSAAHDYTDLTAPRLRREAAVGRRRFEALFDSVADCYLGAGDTLMAAALQAAARDPLEQPPWPLRAERMTVRFCEAVARSPTLARLGFTDVLAPGTAGLVRRERLATVTSRCLRSLAPSSHRESVAAGEASMAAARRLLEAELAGTGARQRMAAATLIPGLIVTVPRSGVVTSR